MTRPRNGDISRHFVAQLESYEMKGSVKYDLVYRYPSKYLIGLRMNFAQLY